MATYFVSPSGSNSNSGTSSGSPWQTVGKVNGTALNPGDSVLFQGGQTFSGTLLALTSLGTALNPITIGSYGTGSATFSNGTNNAINVTNAGGYVIENLNVTGISGSTSHNGIQFFCSGTGSLPAIQVLNCTVTGWQYGLSIGGSTSSDGYAGITVTGGSYNGNIYQGIQVYGTTFNHSSPAYNHSSLAVSNLTVNNNVGSGAVTGSVTGFGMTVGGVNGGTISGVTATGNGTSNGDTSNGPVGIMVYASSGITVTGCLAYANGTGTSADGDGIDLDVDCNGCTVEYCLAYSNAGAGIFGYGGTGDTYWGSVSPNVIRWNLCWGNGTNGAANSNFFGDITLGGNLASAQVYNNTCVSQTSGSAQPPPLAIPTSNTLASCTVRNNILYAGSTASVVTSASAYSTSALLLQGNCYFTAGTFGIKWAATTYASLAAFRAGQSGQEQVSSVNSGFQENPALASAGTSPGVTSAASIPGSAGLKLATGSPLGGQGLDLQGLFSINPGTRDAFGAPVAVPLSVGGFQGPLIPLPAVPGFSSVPGAAVPGDIQPGLVQQGASPPAGAYPFYGHVPLYYLDYLDLTTRHTLVAVPGGSYTMAAVNGRAGLTVPPPDGEWTLGGGFMLRRPGPGFEHSHVQLARARAVNAALQAGRLSVAAPTPPRGGTPALQPEPPGEPSRASLELAAARKANSDLQARLARGEQAGP